MTGRGGAREGAGRPKKVPTCEHVGDALVTAAVYELAMGQSSVELTLDSKGQAKPSVKVYHRDPKKAAAMAREQFDALVLRYCQIPESK